MKHLITLILIFNYLLGSAQLEDIGIQEIDASFTILEIDTSEYCAGKLKDYFKTEFNKNDLPLIDSVLNDFIVNRTNSNLPFLCGVEIRDYNYFYQYVSLRNEIGENVVWINAFSPSLLMVFNSDDQDLTQKERRFLKKRKGTMFTKVDWHKNIVCGNDGCGIFWELKINVDTRTTFDIRISGI